eukprot:5049617-Pyramimonas_sp.AAC.1
MGSSTPRWQDKEKETGGNMSIGCAPCIDAAHNGEFTWRRPRRGQFTAVSYTHLRAHETGAYL